MRPARSDGSSGRQTERSYPRHVERVRVAAPHHPLFGQLVAVVRRKRHAGEPHLVVEGPGGGRQLLPARCAEPAGMVPPAAAPPLTFTPGGLRALVGLAATLRGAPSPVPEAGRCAQARNRCPSPRRYGAPSGPRRTGTWSCSGPTCCSASSRPRGGGRTCQGSRAMNAISPKIEPHHLRLRAVVYVRQSTPRQVLANQESTRRQYQLAERARQMGWPAPQVEVIDEDLGLSGASSHARTGFQRLVAAIGLGEVGLVLVTEVSRLSRRNSDWHRVIELCAVFRTLIADEDGVYDAQDPNDRLLLGVKGTLFAAELHILHARMRGNLLNKARRGELALRLPVGYRRLGDGTVVLDPDEEVRETLALIFERFALLRNARAVQRHFAEHGLKMPRLIQHGAEAGRIVWVRPTYQMIQQVLTSPVYAGVFVYGRRKREVGPGRPARRRRAAPAGGGVGHRRPRRLPGLRQLRPVPAEPAAPAGQPLQLRRQGARGAARGPGAAAGPRGLRPLRAADERQPRQPPISATSAAGRRSTTAPRCARPSRSPTWIDAAGELFLEAVRPAAIETTLAALAVLERGAPGARPPLAAADRTRPLRGAARPAPVRRDRAGEPPGRPQPRDAAGTPRCGCSSSSSRSTRSRGGPSCCRSTRPSERAVRRLAEDLPALWHAATTTDVDRKRLLRLVVTEVVLTVDAERRRAEATVVWSGGATTRHEVRCPPRAGTAAPSPR